MATITTPQDMIRRWAYICKRYGKIDRNISLVFENQERDIFFEFGNEKLQLDSVIGDKVFQFMILCRDKKLIEISHNVQNHGQQSEMKQYLWSFTSLDSIDELLSLTDHI